MRVCMCVCVCVCVYVKNSVVVSSGVDRPPTKMDFVCFREFG